MIQIRYTLFSPILTFLTCIIITTTLMFAPVGQIVGPWLYYDLPLVTMGLVIVIGIITKLIVNSDTAWHVADFGQSILVTAFFGLALTLLIHQQLHTRWVVWGLFQINDAADFLGSAITYLHEGSFFTPRGRVISNLLYAGLIDLTEFDLRASAWIVTWITVLSTVSLVAVLTRCMGVSVGLIATFVLLQFAYEHIGGTTTELPGFAFGLSATALLIYGARNGCRTAVLVGYTILCVAMVTRIGAVLVLPGILIWSFYYLPPLFGRRWLVGVAGLLITALVMLGNSALTKQISPQSGGSFVNAVDSWYAIIVEGQLMLGQRPETSVIPVTRWVQIYRDYPDIQTLPIAERPQRKQVAFFDALAASPMAATVGSLREIMRYFSDFLMYRFVEIKPARVLLTLLTVVGVGNLLFFSRKKQNPVGGLLGITFIALVISQPFLYGGESRVPAPTVGLLAATTGHGWNIFNTMLRRQIGKMEDSRNFFSYGDSSIYAWCAILPALALAIIVLVGVSAGASWRTDLQTSIKSGACEPGNNLAIVVTGKGSSIVIGGTNGNTYDDLRSRGLWIDKRLRSDVNSYLPFLPAVHAIVNPAMIGYGVDMVRGRLLSPLIHQATGQSQLLTACVRNERASWWLSDAKQTNE